MIGRMAIGVQGRESDVGSSEELREPAALMLREQIKWGEATR